MSSDPTPELTAPALTALVFKICPRADWAAAVVMGAMAGSADDMRDGYIHLSTAAQATATARKYFAGRTDLVLVGYDAAALGSQLVWEPSRGGALFPHLYAPLPTALALAVQPLQLGPDDVPDIAAALASFIASFSAAG
jgi:uncharacterized protein (DUF952 family)